MTDAGTKREWRGSRPYSGQYHNRYAYTIMTCGELFSVMSAQHVVIEEESGSPDPRSIGKAILLGPAEPIKTQSSPGEWN